MVRIAHTVTRKLLGGGSYLGTSCEGAKRPGAKRQRGETSINPTEPVVLAVSEHNA